MFLGVVVGLVFFDSVLPRLLFYNCVFRSRKCLGKILFTSGLLVLGICFFSLWFSVVVAFLFLFFLFFFKRESSGLTGHTPTRTLCSCSFFLFLSPRFGLSPVLAVRPSFLAFCRGAILGPGRFLDSPGTPLRLLLGREAAWVLLVASLLSCVFFPFCVVCGCTRFPSRPE